MAEVAKAVAPPRSDSNHFAGVGGGSINTTRTLLKRKTPSQLRGEQLKRRIEVDLVHESFSIANMNKADSGTKKTEALKNTRYIDKRLDEVYQARKPTSRPDLFKPSFKESQLSIERSRLKSSFSSNVILKSHQDLNSKHAGVVNANENISGQCQSSEKEHQNRFHSVAELSLGFDKFSEQLPVDVDKALKGIAAHASSGSRSPASSTDKSDDVKTASLGKFYSEIHVPGRKVPLDVTLKTAFRISSSSSVDWLRRLFVRGTFNGTASFSSQSGYSGNLSDCLISTNICSLHSWIYPQSSLPASVISVLSSSTMGEMDFLDKRQMAWEDSFRSLYYLLRKSRCSIFYVCAPQFVVIFSAVDGVKKGKRTCNAYISQSTRGLRSLLREHDISYSMPFCYSEVEQISREDLVELSEIEKQNLGQVRRMSSMPDVDSSPKSLLAFNGNESVHALYDFLLNYRSLLTMLRSMDVPVLCAPIPFLNAALSSPEVKCKEIKRADSSQSKESIKKDGMSIDGSSGGVCYSLELKSAYLPPWIVSSVCSAMCSEEKTFEASFTTEPNSMGLNVALGAVDRNSGKDETREDSFGISATIVTSDMRTACLKGLKYSDGAYVASLSPL